MAADATESCRARRPVAAVAAAATAGFLSLGVVTGPEEPRPAPSTVVADSAGRFVYVAERDGQAVTVLDVEREAIHARYSIPGAPTGLALQRTGARLYATVGVADGRVLALDARTGEILRSVAVGHSPVAPVIAPDQVTLWLCHRFANEVAALDLATGKIRARIPVPREPVAAALTSDGAALVVANHLPAGAAIGAHTGAAISIIDPTAAKLLANVTLPNGATGLRSICLSPDGRYAYASHIIGRYGLPATQLDRGWVNTNAVSVIDVRRRTLVASVLLDDVDRGAANPWGIACSADGELLCIAHSGTHEISLIDRPELHRKIAAAEPGDIEIADDLAFLAGLRRRVRVAGRGPRELALAGGRVFVAEYFSDTVGVMELAPDPGDAPRSIALGPPRAADAARRGAELFHDAEICFQSWQSCASCHPDGRTDGLNWDLPNDGIGNPKNAKSMLLAHATPPAMISGVRDRAESAVRAGLRHIHVAVRSEQDAADIDEYLAGLLPVPSPHLIDGKPSAAARRGERIFRRRGCAECHPAPLYTDLKAYDVGTATGREAGHPLDTPTLVEAWRTAPYLHDGRAASLRQALAIHEAVLRKGKGEPLAAPALDDLTAFVSTL